MKFTIERKDWYRGKEDGAKLRDCNGMKCCLGFYLEACGVTSDATLDAGLPQDLGDLIQDDYPRAAKWLVSSIEVDDDTSDWARFYDTKATDRLVAINDDPDLTDPDRESAIAKIFAENGIEVEFK